MVSLTIVLGTRPEIIKMAPIILEAKQRNIDLTVIHTGQHYDENMSKQYFESLDIDLPDINLGVKSEYSYEQLNLMIRKLGDLFINKKPNLVLAVGDTISVLACSLVCVQNRIPFGHLEAGLRSFDLTMPEEVNRKLVDCISSILFAPSEIAVTNLHSEGIDPSRIYQTGNTFVDSIRIYKSMISQKKGLIADSILDKVPQNYIICTIHRIANVDDETRFREIIKTLIDYRNHSIIFIVHPRTEKKIRELQLKEKLDENKNLFIFHSIDFLSMLKLMSNSRCLLILTDSGGLQEEAAVLRKPCITIRPNTERPETVRSGINTLVDANEKQIVREIKRILSEDFDYRYDTFDAPYGEGYASKKILDIIERNYDNLGFQSPETFKTGAKSHYLLELGANIDKKEIEDQFNCSVISVYDDNGKAVSVKNKLKKGYRIRILKN